MILGLRSYISHLIIIVSGARLYASKTDSLIREYTLQKDGLNKIYTAGSILLTVELPVGIYLHKVNGVFKKVIKH